MRVRQSTAVLVVLPTIVGLDQVPVAATTIAATLYNADGTTLASPTVSSADTTNPGYYTVTLTSTHTASLQRLRLKTVAVVATYTHTFWQDIEVVGAHYIELSDLRLDSTLTNPDRLSNADLAAYRDEFEDMVEKVCGVAFVRRFERVTLTGDGSSNIDLRMDLLPRDATVVSVTINGDAEDETEFTVTRSGQCCWLNGVFPLPNSTDGRENVVIELEHGYTAPPADLRRQCTVWVRSKSMADRAAVPSNRISDEQGRFSTPDPRNGRPTGLLDLDPILVRLTERLPGIA